MNRSTILLACVAMLSGKAHAELRVPHIFGDNMVLQREKPAAVWGWADGDRTRNSLWLFLDQNATSAVSL
ncbi:MAG: hypothetical protein QGH15_13660 [Kiritimatiellia bacterium]|nr:hypothetical protein [Kiritimatiellia bacterium]